MPFFAAVRFSIRTPGLRELTLPVCLYVAWFICFFGLTEPRIEPWAIKLFFCPMGDCIPDHRSFFLHRSLYKVEQKSKFTSIIKLAAVRLRTLDLWVTRQLRLPLCDAVKLTKYRNLLLWDMAWFRFRVGTFFSWVLSLISASTTVLMELRN